MLDALFVGLHLLRAALNDTSYESFSLDCRWSLESERSFPERKAAGAEDARATALHNGCNSTARLLDPGVQCGKGKNLLRLPAALLSFGALSALHLGRAGHKLVRSRWRHQTTGVLALLGRKSFRLEWLEKPGGEVAKALRVCRL